jgi:ribonuclease P protein component
MVERPKPAAAKPNALPRARRLRRSGDFARIERQGQRAQGAFVVVVAKAGRGEGRVGFTVSKKVGNAVARNHVKRRLRDVMRRHKTAWNGRDVVIIAKPESAGRELAELEADLLATLRKLDETRPPPPIEKKPTRGAHGKPARR